MPLYLGLGSNLGDRRATLRRALRLLAGRLTVVGVSGLYETEPVGYTDQPPFLNAVVACDTDASADQALAWCQGVEAALGRERSVRWGPRTLDVDVLLIDDLVIATDDLEVPHPRMWERAFVLAPLHDVAPDLVDAPAGGWAGVRRAPVALRRPG